MTRYRLGPACWLWDYLRRSRTQGYFLPLSGGIDSCATAVIVHSMCRLVIDAASNGGKALVLLLVMYLTTRRGASDCRLTSHDWRTRAFNICSLGPQRVCPSDFPYLLHGHRKLESRNTKAGQGSGRVDWKVLISILLCPALLNQI